MAYETKAILSGMAEYALLARNKQMYKYVSKVANVEGLVLKSYEEASKEMEEEQDA